MSDLSADQRARQQGWVPEDEWDDARAETEGRRKPARFLSAEEFLEKVESSSPMMRAQLRRNSEEISGLKKTAEEMRDLLKSQHEMAKRANSASYERGLKDAAERRRQAIVDADVAAADEAQKDIDAIKAKAAEAESAPEKDKPKGESGPKEPKLDPATKEWVDDNDDWFRDDSRPVLNATMIHEHKKVLAEGKYGTGVKSLNEAKRRVQEKFPEEFGINPNRDGAGRVAKPTPGGGSAADGIEAKFAALPAEDRATYERHRKMFEADGKTKYTKAEFLEAYGS